MADGKKRVDLSVTELLQLQLANKPQSSTHVPNYRGFEFIA
jgi:hypothetical protein